MSVGTEVLFSEEVKLKNNIDHLYSTNSSILNTILLSNISGNSPVQNTTYINVP